MHRSLVISAALALSSAVHAQDPGVSNMGSGMMTVITVQ